MISGSAEITTNGSDHACAPKARPRRCRPNMRCSVCSSNSMAAAMAMTFKRVPARLRTGRGHPARTRHALPPSQETGTAGLGFIHQEQVDRRPARSVYTLTPEGQAELNQWMGEPVEHTREIRLAFLVKLFLARLIDPKRAAELIAEQIATLERLEQAQRECRPHPAFRATSARCAPPRPGRNSSGCERSIRAARPVSAVRKRLLWPARPDSCLRGSGRARS